MNLRSSLASLAAAGILAQSAPVHAAPVAITRAPAAEAAARVAAAHDAAAAPVRAAIQEQVKAATSSPASNPLAAKPAPGTQAINDTLPLLSHGFDTLTGACDPRGWQAEDRTNEVFAHVSDRFKVNRSIFSWAQAASPEPLPANTAGTAILPPQAVASNDSGMVFFVEKSAGGARVVAVYPDQNLMRQYADLPVFPAVTNQPYHLAYDRATGGLIVGTTNSNSIVGGQLYRIPAGGGTPVKLAGVGGSGNPNDAPVASALFDVPQAIATDQVGNIYFNEVAGYPMWPRVRKLGTDGWIRTLAGSGFAFYYGYWNDYGDGGLGTHAALVYPTGLTINTAGDTLYVVDGLSNRIRTIDIATGIINGLPGAQAADFSAVIQNMSPFVAAYTGGQLTIGSTSGVLTTWSGGTLAYAAGATTSLAEPADSSLGASHRFGWITDVCAAPGGDALVCDGKQALLYRLDTSRHVSVTAGAYGSMLMGTKALWFGADSASAPSEVANWTQSSGYGGGWSQRLTSPEFSFADHPTARLAFDARSDMRAQGGGLPASAEDGFFTVRGLQPDGQWVLLPAHVVTDATSSDAPAIAARVGGVGPRHCEVDLSGAPLAGVTRLQIMLETYRFFSNEDGYGTSSGAGALVIDNLRLTDAGYILPPLDFEDGTTGDWTLSALNGAYGDASGTNDMVIRDVPPPATQVELRSGFDYSDPTCAWTFTSPGDSVADGTYSRITSPWLALADRDAPFYVSVSGKFATDNQKRYVKYFVRGKNAGDSRPTQLASSFNLFSSGTSGGDLSAPYLDSFVLTYPDDFGLSTEGFLRSRDSVQIVIQIEDQAEERVAVAPAPRVRSKLPYLDNVSVFQRSGDDDHDGVPNAHDACPLVASAGQDTDGDGCPDATATLRHVESWPAASLPLHFRISQDGDPSIHDGSDKAAIRAAVATWMAVPDAAVTMVEDPETAQMSAGALDGVNLITFEDDLQFSPDILAVTPTTSFTRRAAFDDQLVLPGQIVDSDLIFNSAARYQTAGTGPLAGAVDLQSVATHEIGHMLGLSHSGATDATMYPVLQDGDGAASLEDDDRSAIASAYPGPNFAADFGSISGSVLRGSPGGLPVPGALVTAWALDGSNAPTHVVASDYSDEQGKYALRGLPASGPYGLRIDPLDGSIPGLVPAAINERVMTSAQTNFAGEWWSSPEDGTEDPASIQPVSVTAGSPLSGYVLVTPRDIIPPTIVSVLPADGASGIGIDGRVLVNFSEPVEASTIGQAFALRVAGQTGRLGGAGNILNGNKTFVFTPTFPLQFETNYEIEVGTQLTDRQGNALAAPFISHFNTMITPQVAIFDVIPRQAPPGALITIKGQGFGGTSVSLQLPIDGGSSFTLALGSATSIVANLPDNAVSGPIIVTVDGVPSIPFNYTVSPPGRGIPVPSGAPVYLPFAPSDVAVSPEGGTVFAIGNGGFASVNLSPTRPLFRVADVEAIPGASQLALAVDGRHAYVTRPDFSDLVEVVTDTTEAGFGHLHRSILLPGRPGGVYVAPDGDNAFVPELDGSRVFVVDVNPGSATFGSVVRQLLVPGVRLAGGAAVGSITATTRSQPAAHTKPGPFTPNAGAPYQALFLNSAESGLIAFDLGSDSTFTVIDPTPCAGRIVSTIAGDGVVSAGAGANADAIVQGCLQYGCGPVPTVVLGGGVRNLAMSPQDGSLLVANGVFGQLQVLNPTGGGYALGGQVRTGRSPVAVATSADGGLVAIANAGDRSIGLFGLTNSPEIHVPSNGAGSPGDVVTAVLTEGTSAGYVADLGAGAIEPGYRRARGLSFTVPNLPQGDRALSLESATLRTPSQRFRVVDPISGFAPHTVETDAVGRPESCDGVAPARALSLTVSHDGSRFAMVREHAGCIVWSLHQLRDDAPEQMFSMLGPEVNLGDSGTPVGAALTPDGLGYWLALGIGGVAWFDADPASPAFGSGGHRTDNYNVYAVAADPLDDIIAVAVDAYSGQPNRVEYCYANDGTRFAHTDIPDTARSLAFTPDGALLVVGGAGRALFIDVQTELQIAASPSPQHAAAGQVVAVATTADGRRAVGAFADGSIAVWSVESPDAGTELWFGQPLGSAHVTRLLPAPNGTGVIGSCSDAPLAFLDAATLPPTVGSGGPSSPSAMARTPDGRHLLLGIPGGADDDSTALVSLSPASRALLVSGGDQEALAQTTLPLPVRVRLYDAQDHPQAGALLEFSLPLDGSQGTIGGVFSVRRFTDAGGEAQVSWSMPSVAGAVAMTVAAPGLPVPALTVNARSADDPTSAAPQLVALGPAEGAVGVAAGTELYARFSQAMGDSASVCPGIRVRIGNDIVPGHYRSDDRRTIFFKPAEPLPYLASASLEVDSGIPDAYNHPLASGGLTHFTVQAEPTLNIAVLSPPAGKAGTAVTLNGQGFSPVAALNAVSFNGVETPVLSATPTSMVVRVPAHSASGPVTARVGALGSNGLPFVVLPDSGGPGAVVDTMPTRPAPLNLVVTPDGHRAYVVSPRVNAVGALDIFTAQQLAVIPVGANPRGIGMLPDGSRAYVANYDGNDVTVIGTSPDSTLGYNRAIATIKVGKHPIGVVILAGGPRVLVLNAGDSTASIIDAQRGNATFDQIVRSIPLPSGGNAVNVSPDGTRAFIVTGDGVSIVDLSSYIVKSIPLPSGGNAVNVSPDGGLLFVLTNDHHLVVIDIASNSSSPNRIIASIPLPSGGNAVNVSPDGTRLFVTLTDDGSVIVFDLRTSAGPNGGGSSAPGAPVSVVTRQSIPVGTAPAGMAVDPFGRYVLVANEGSDNLTLIQTSTEAPRITVAFPNGGETLAPGQVATLLWNTEGLRSGQAVVLRLTRDQGQSFETIASGIPNTGAYDWTVTGPMTYSGVSPLFDAFLEVSATNLYGNTGRDSSDHPFAIFDLTTGTELVSFRAEPGGAGVELHWQFTQAAGAADPVIERSEVAAGPWTRLSAVATASEDGMRLVDLTARPGRTYLYRLTATLANGKSATFGPVSVIVPVTEFALSPISPNPSPAAVSIEYAVARQSRVRLSILDIAGREVARLADGERAAGLYHVRWSGASHGGTIAAGMYFVRYEAAGRTFVRRVALTP